MFKLLWCFIVGHRRTRLRMQGGAVHPLIEMKEPRIKVEDDWMPGLHLKVEYCSRCGLAWGEITTPRERGLVREIETVQGKMEEGDR